MTHKYAKDHDDAWEIQETYIGKPHGWIQWKGTDVCMDIHCTCGTLSHIDDSHCYFVQCPECKRIYFVNGNVEFIEMIDFSDSDLAKIPDIIGAQRTTD